MIQLPQDLFDDGLGFSVRVDRRDARVLRDGNFFGIAIDGGGGGKHEAPDARLCHGFEQRYRAADVVGKIQLRLAHGFAHRAMGREMNHRIHALKQARDSGGVLQAQDMQAFRRDVFAMATGKVVDHDHIKTAIQ